MVTQDGSLPPNVFSSAEYRASTGLPELWNASSSLVGSPPFVDRTWLFVNDVVREEGALQPA